MVFNWLQAFFVFTHDSCNFHCGLFLLCRKLFFYYIITNKMKKTQFLKAFALSLATAFVMLLPTTMNAQKSDGFFLNNEDNYASRNSSGYSIFVEQFGGENGGGQGGFNIGTEQFGDAPLGSGLFIMAAAGAAYAFSKKRKKQENN